MRKLTVLVICVSALWVTALLPVTAARAGDEDLTSSVYLVFDPETGEFVTVDDQNRAKQDHDAEEPAPLQIGAGYSPKVPQADTARSSFLTGIAVGFGLLAGVLLWIQIRRQKSPTR